MNTVLETEHLTKRYGTLTALADATLTVPTGRVVGLVGPNGAGKSTLMGMMSGLLAPTEGTIRVLGQAPAKNAAQLARVGFVAQDTPVYAGLTVAEHLTMGRRLNPGWDDDLAQKRIRSLGLDPRKKPGKLSGGQRAQLALTLAAAKRPELLILDEPVAALDPLARRAFLQNMMEFTAELETSVVLSSHLLGDVERVCDHLIVLADARVQIAGDVDELVGAHYRLIGPRDEFEVLPPGVETVHADHSERQSTLILRDMTGDLPSLLPTATPIGLEDMVLAYLTRAAGSAAATSLVEA